MRFNRDYELTVAVGGQAVTIKPPIRIVFSADKSIDTSLNTLRAAVYNLSPQNRAALVRDSEDTGRAPVELKGGYNGKLVSFFRGTVKTAGSERQGVDIVTIIEGIDGGEEFLRGFTTACVRSNDAAIESVIATMPTIKKGKITEQRQLVRPRVVVANNIDALKSHLGEGEQLFIDDEQVYILKPKQVISDFAPVVSAATGLINTPKRDNKKTIFTTMLNPTIKVGGLCSLSSSTAVNLNGIYKVEVIQYQGDNYGNEWQQTITGVLAPDYEVI